jgi:hypothetical protein
MTAVVHHGGAGTTSTGLIHGCSTWICPFFGDQHFWGEMVYRAGLGPKPVSVHSLTLQTVIDSLELLLNDKILRTASAISDCMMKEDGVEGAVHAFYKHLPLENMLCDVSLFRGEYRLAQVFCKECNLKMSKDVSDYIHSTSSLHLQDHYVNGSIVPCCYMDWTLPPPQTPQDGLVQGIGGFVHEFTEGVAEVVYDPVKGIYEDGLQGAATGIVTGLNRFVNHQITGSGLLYERCKDILSILKNNNNWRKDKRKDQAENSDNPKLQEIKDELTYYSHFNKKVSFRITHECSEKTKEWRLLRFTQPQTGGNNINLLTGGMVKLVPMKLLMQKDGEERFTGQRKEKNQSNIEEIGGGDQEEGTGGWFSNNNNNKSNLSSSMNQSNVAVGLELTSSNSPPMEEINLNNSGDEQERNVSHPYLINYGGEQVNSNDNSEENTSQIINTSGLLDRRTAGDSSNPNSVYFPGRNSRLGADPNRTNIQRELSASVYDGEITFGNNRINSSVEEGEVEGTRRHHELVITPPPSSLNLPLLESPIISAMSTGHHTPNVLLSPARAAVPSSHKTPSSITKNTQKNQSDEDRGPDIENVISNDNIICQSIYSRSDSFKHSKYEDEEEEEKDRMNDSVMIPTMSTPDRHAQKEYQYYSKVDWLLAFKQANDAFKLFQRLNKNRNTR